MSLSLVHSVPKHIDRDCTFVTLLNDNVQGFITGHLPQLQLRVSPRPRHTLSEKVAGQKPAERWREHAHVQCKTEEMSKSHAGETAETLNQSGETSVARFFA